jgi:hypothetical protein
VDIAIIAPAREPIIARGPTEPLERRAGSMAQNPADPWGQEDTGGGAGLADFLTFRWMITPVLITVIWILSVILITVLALAAFRDNPLVAVGGWVAGMIWLRVVFEVMIVLFKINDGIQELARRARQPVSPHELPVGGAPEPASVASAGLDAGLPQLDLARSTPLGFWIVREAPAGIFSPGERVNLALSEGRLLLARGRAILYDPEVSQLDVVVADDLFIRLVERGEPLVTLDWESGMHGRALARRLALPG